jgi:hypothetical protein
VELGGKVSRGPLHYEGEMRRLTLDEDETVTQSNFARMESGDGARGIEVQVKFKRRSVYRLSALGGLNCVHV